MHRKLIKQVWKTKKTNRDLVSKHTVRANEPECAETTKDNMIGYLDPPGIETAGGGSWNSYEDIFESHMRGNR